MNKKIEFEDLVLILILVLYTKPIIEGSIVRWLN